MKEIIMTWQNGMALLDNPCKLPSSRKKKMGGSTVAHLRLLSYTSPSSLSTPFPTKPLTVSSNPFPYLQMLLHAGTELLHDGAKGQIRYSFAEIIKSKGVTMTALLAKATSLALVKHPVINSSCRDGNSFTYNSSINIAVAVATEGGLITP
ncbi:hypothetical protein PIB30_074535, partial [Stylosanthes scabra]|nr:hypothetical protein [Stylosanthes scabra]